MILIMDRLFFKSLLVALILITTLFSFIGCSEYVTCNGENGFSAGYSPSKDILDSLSAQIFTSTEAPSTSTPITEDQLFYWTSGGTKFHLFSDCQHIEKSSEISSGSLSEAKNAKSGGVCSTCLKKSGINPEFFS